jgi:hypothetical protein
MERLCKIGLKCYTRRYANHVEIESSNQCGCFYCRKLFGSGQIVNWIDTDSPHAQQTALRPLCGIGSVIGSAPGLGITVRFFEEMHTVWFGENAGNQRVRIMIAPVLECSLCGKPHDEVRKIIVGHAVDAQGHSHKVSLCNECIATFMAIMASEDREWFDTTG